MHTLLALPWSDETLSEYSGAQDFTDSCRRFGLSGLEVCRAGEVTLPHANAGKIVGVHLPFFANWMDFWHGNRAALEREFGSEAVWRGFYGGAGREALVELYRRELLWAQAAGARYAVFHVSQVTTREVFTYRCAYTDLQVAEAAAQLLNAATEGLELGLEILLENLNWAGLNYRDPAVTARLLELVRYPRVGLMLDVGHLMCTNPALRTQEEGCRFVHAVLTRHGALCGRIRGVHLHASVSGDYVRKTLESPPELTEEFYARFAQSYRHVQRVDTHGPMTAPGIAELLARIAPEYLTHEVAGATRAVREAALQQQLAALGTEGLPCA